MDKEELIAAILKSSDLFDEETLRTFSRDHLDRIADYLVDGHNSL